jgi:acetyl-CoA C-acetyltransferase
VAFDDSRLNPNGGAIAIGHPLGASGARLAYSAVRQLERSNGRSPWSACALAWARHCLRN